MEDGQGHHVVCDESSWPGVVLEGLGSLSQKWLQGWMSTEEEVGKKNKAHSQCKEWCALKPRCLPSIEGTLPGMVSCKRQANLREWGGLACGSAGPEITLTLSLVPFQVCIVCHGGIQFGTVVSDAPRMLWWWNGGGAVQAHVSTDFKNSLIIHTICKASVDDEMRFSKAGVFMRIASSE